MRCDIRTFNFMYEGLTSQHFLKSKVRILNFKEIKKVLQQEILITLRRLKRI